VNGTDFSLHLSAYFSPPAVASGYLDPIRKANNCSEISYEKVVGNSFKNLKNMPQHASVQHLNYNQGVEYASMRDTEYSNRLTPAEQPDFTDSRHRLP
jgi:hypothetical protein